MQKEDKVIFIIKIVIVILSIITIGLITYEFNFERKATKFELIGKSKIVLEYGEEYKEQGFKAYLKNENMAKRVVITSNVNEKKVGKYEVRYNLRIKHLNFNRTLVRKVIIKDTKKPELKVDSEKEVKLYIGDEYEIPECTAIDNVDGDITEKVKVEDNINLSEVGTYEIKYSVKDSSNNESIEKIIIHVEEKRKNAYIDISISEQVLRYYEYDELVLYSDIVTGINDGTPVGNFSVVNKARNVNLKGEDYVSFVNYWIAFLGYSYGMHDASWRSSFGGSIYVYNGSHGCVNMPYYKVQQLYYMVEIGTPVYIRY